MKIAFVEIQLRGALFGFACGYHYKNKGRKFFRCVFSVPMMIGG